MFIPDPPTVLVALFSRLKFNCRKLAFYGLSVPSPEIFSCFNRSKNAAQTKIKQKNRQQNHKHSHSWKCLRRQQFRHQWETGKSPPHYSSTLSLSEKHFTLAKTPNLI